MIFTETPLSGTFVIEPDPIEDERGFFARIFCVKSFAERGLNPSLNQLSMSYNSRRGIVRGLHLQRPPHMEAKLIRVTAGAIFDAVVDLRAGSPTYGRWFGIELSASNRKQLYVPEGCAHGLQTVSDVAEVTYHISAPFSPEHADGVRWNDVDLGIAWPNPAAAFLSERDAALGSFARFIPVQC
jgi:dTDP-4-dehydrorhamnose 3,5-epimerase